MKWNTDDPGAKVPENISDLNDKKVPVPHLKISDLTGLLLTAVYVPAEKLMN